MGMDIVPDPIGGVFVVTLPHRLPRPEGLTRKITPRDPCPGAVNHGLNDPTVIPKRVTLTAFIAGQQRLDPLPLLISQNLIPGGAGSAHGTSLDQKTPYIWETCPSDSKAAVSKLIAGSGDLTKDEVISLGRLNFHCFLQGYEPMVALFRATIKLDPAIPDLIGDELSRV